MKIQNLGRGLRFAAMVLPLTWFARPAFGQAQRTATASGCTVIPGIVRRRRSARTLSSRTASSLPSSRSL